jgi:hypothetical protein
MVVKKHSPSPWIAIWISVISAVATVVAVVFAELAWRGSEEANQIARDALKISNSAHIDFDIDSNTDDSQVGFAIRSTGHGTAVVGEIQYFVDGQPVKNLGAALVAAKLDPEVNHGWYVDPGYLMTPGEVNWLLDYHSKDAAVNDRLTDFISRLSIRVSYCSVTQECETACYPDRTCKTTTAKSQETAATPVQTATGGGGESLPRHGRIRYRSKPPSPYDP